jgi:hypothetical protein
MIVRENKTRPSGLKGSGKMIGKIGVTYRLGKNGKTGSFVLVGEDGYTTTKYGWCTSEKAWNAAKREQKLLTKGKPSRRSWEY